MQNNNIVKISDIELLKDELMTKADRYELSSLYDCKSNKEDIGLVINILQQLHKQILQISTINLSTVKALKDVDIESQKSDHNNITQMDYYGNQSKNEGSIKSNLKNYVNNTFKNDKN